MLNWLAFENDVYKNLDNNPGNNFNSAWNKNLK